MGKIINKIKKYLCRTQITHGIFLKLLFNGNKFIGHLPQMQNSKIIITGANNILFCEKNVKIRNSVIKFNANNSLIYLCSGVHRYNVSIYNNSVFYVGKNNYFNPHGKTIEVILSEEKNIFIGNNNLFSKDIVFRTADPHLIYDSISHKRINMSKSIYIGDHVWIGEHTSILKGSQICSGSILGTKSILSNRMIPSNECWGGVPAKRLRSNIFWNGECVHNWVMANTKNSIDFTSDEYIYNKDENAIAFYDIDSIISNKTTPIEKLRYLQNLSQNKNRFCS